MNPLAAVVQFVVRKDAPEITKLDDFKGEVVAVNKSAVCDSWARELAGKIGWTPVVRLMSRLEHQAGT